MSNRESTSHPDVLSRDRGVAASPARAGTIASKPAGSVSTRADDRGAGRDPASYLKIEGVTLSYGSFTALHALSLEIRSGEFFCLLGPSGCGKSTTLGVVAGFLPVTDGRVLLAGADVTRLPPQRRRIGVVFQSYALFPHMTAAENIGYGLRLQKRDKREIEERVSTLLKLVRLETKAGRYPRELSGGEQQRVAIARALAIEPRLLLLDEPLSNLDARLREEMRVELKRIHRETGITTVFVTHDQEEAFGVGDRVGVMNNGRLEQVGTPEEIYGCPASLFVANFIGRSNRIGGVLDPVERSGTLVTDTGDVLRVPDGERIAGRHVLFIRPEQVRLSASAREVNSFEALVTEAVYSGTLINYRLQTKLGELQACRIANAEQQWAVGQTVFAGWPAECGWLLAEEGR